VLKCSWLVSKIAKLQLAGIDREMRERGMSDGNE